MKKKAGALAVGSVVMLHWAGAAMGQEAVPARTEGLTVVEVTGNILGKGEARANSVIDKETILLQPAGLDPLKLLTRVPGLQVSSSDALTGSFSMRLSMRGLNKEQIGISIDGIPNGSTLSNGGTMPNRLLDPANVVRVDASQTAGDLGTPSNQALGGYINFRTRDPAKKRGGDVELSAGSFGYHREFLRYDTGRSGGGLSAFVDLSHEYVKTWPGEQSGRNKRNHIDAKLLQELPSGSLRATVSYNQVADNDYDAVALRAVAARFYKAVFEVNPDTDGLTDRWTGNPNIDQNNRSTRGINSDELFAHAEWQHRFSAHTKLTFKPYYHHQSGNGWFYVPYKQMPADGVVFRALGAGEKPAASIRECYDNQYQRSVSGALVKTPSVVYPAGASAATLSAAGCPAAAAYAMNPASQWGAREATTRRSDNEIKRTGMLAEGSTYLGEFHKVRAGAWFENTKRKKIRNWFEASNPAVGYAYREADLYSVTQDRYYNSDTAMGYLQDKMTPFGDKVELDLGVTYQSFREDYRSVVEFKGTRELKVNSGFLPKVAALYRIDDDWEVFASGSKNFSAIPDSVFEGTAAVDAKQGIKPETSVNKDLGIRFGRGPYGLALTVYDIDYRDRISIQNGTPNGDIFSRDATTTFRNQGGISSRGAELTARAAGAGYELYANYAFNKARYVGDTPAEGIKAGDPVLGAARHTGFAEAAWIASPALRVTANAKYVGEAAGTYGTVANTVVAGGPAFYPREYMPAYTVVGLSLRYRPAFEALGLKNPELSFNVDNLFNKRYLGGLGAELTTSSPLVTGRYFLGSPRTLFFTLRAGF